MELGIILDFFHEEKTGKLITIGDLEKSVGQEYKAKYCLFKLEECNTVIYNYKIVAIENFEFIDQTRVNIRTPPYWAEKFDYWALGVNDRIGNIGVHNIFMPTDYSLKYLKPKIPYYNPSLFNFFFTNELIELSSEWDHYLGIRPGEVVKRIEGLKNLTDEIENFSIEKAIESYSVSIESYSSSSPGKDDSASITMVGARKYWPIESKYDPFIDQYLDNFNTQIAYDKGWVPGDRLLWELWEQIGGKEKEIELEKECISIREQKIQRLLQNYSIEKHINYIRREAFKEERDLKHRIENAYRRIKFF